MVIVNSREPFLDPNFWYVTGAMGGLFESSIAVLRGGAVKAIVSKMEEESARRGRATVKVYDRGRGKDDLVREALDGVETIGLNYEGVTHADVVHLQEVLRDVRFKDVGSSLARCRSIKDSEEIKLISQACAISSKVAEELPELVERGMTEQRLAARIDSMLREEGSEGPPFETIVAFGDNAAHPHHRPGDRRLKDGMVVLCDFGATYRRYCSDMTRTLFCGPPRERERSAYTAVQEAQEKAITSMCAGVEANEPDRVAREIIGSAGFEGKFIHSLGHEIGLSVHEGGVMSPRSNHTLVKDMVMSAEPGIYLPGRFGIRIEDTVRITADGGRRMTDSDRSLRVV